MQKNLENVRKKIRKELLAQLKKNGTDNVIYTDRVDDYLQLWDVKNDLLRDIEERGKYIEVIGPGGRTNSKQNESVLSVLKYSDHMAKLLESIGINQDSVAALKDEDEECDL